MNPKNKERKGRRRGYGSRRSLVQVIAKERIHILLGLARTKVRDREIHLARRYVQLAKRISTRTKAQIPREDKRFLCKKCNIPLIPGLNARVRLSPEKSLVTITCLECQHVSRHPYAREKSYRRKRKTVNPYMTRPPAREEFQKISELGGQAG